MSPDTSISAAPAIVDAAPQCNQLDQHLGHDSVSGSRRTWLSPESLPDDDSPAPATTVMYMRISILMLVLCLLLSGGLPAHADPLGLTPPVPGRAMTLFDTSSTRYSAGHRGVDLAASPGDDVLASAAGTVYFAGMVAGRPTLSVDHGGVRSTYTPVLAQVSAGEQITGGQMLGIVATDDHCRSKCLHWGLTDGVDHFDPLAELDTPGIRLLPMGSLPVPRQSLPSSLTRGGSPVTGPISSAFGMRVHPITGVRKLHDGADIAAACGTPVRAPLSGRVVSASFHSAYGFRVIMDHAGVRTAYAHLQSLEVNVGNTLAAGDRLGSVGSTGMSTGCHLHWMAWRNGALIDPMTLTMR